MAIYISVRMACEFVFFFSSRRRHTRFSRDWSSDVCSSDLLMDGPRHGYAIIKQAAEASHGRVRLSTGTLYTALDRLTAEGYVRPLETEVVNGRTRRSY